MGVAVIDELKTNAKPECFFFSIQCLMIKQKLQSLPEVVGTLRTLVMTGVIFLFHSSL